MDRQPDTHGAPDSRAEPGVLGELLAAHTLLQRLPGTNTALEFVTHALLIVPGVVAAAARVPSEGLEVFDGDWAEAQAALGAFTVDRRVGHAWHALEGVEVLVLDLGTLQRSYGSLYAATGERSRLEPYLPFLSNLAGSVALTVENQIQRRAVEYAADELLVSRLEYQLLFQEMTSGLALHEILTDELGHPSDYRFVSVNRAFEQMTGLMGKDIVGRTVLEVLPGVDRSWIETYGAVALKGAPARFERYEPSLGRHYEVVAYCPRRGQFATIINDITQRKQTEEELSRTAAAMEEAYRRQRAFAESLQLALLPTVPVVDGVEIDTVCRSASAEEIIGGDFYDVFKLPEDRLALIIGDVCCKGIPAAAQMALVRATFRATAHHSSDPGRWLSAVNESLALTDAPSDPIRVAVSVLRPETGEVRCALAGHPPPLVVTEGSVGELAERSGLPLGLESGPVYHSCSSNLPQDGVLLLYTDGLRDARRESAQFGEERLHDTARALLARPFPGAAAWLVEAAQEFAGGRLADDAAVMLVRRR